MKVPYVLLLGFLPVATMRAALPAEVTVTTPAQFELMRNGHVSGTISLAVGARLEVIDVADDYLLVRYRNTNGRVLTARTDLPPGAMMNPCNRPRTRCPRGSRRPLRCSPRRSMPRPIRWSGPWRANSCVSRAGRCGRSTARGWPA
ncbi:MAG: hypothetical protein ACHQ4G_09945 [Opitutales bacterium]